MVQRHPASNGTQGGGSKRPLWTDKDGQGLDLNPLPILNTNQPTNTNSRRGQSPSPEVACNF